MHTLWKRHKSDRRMGTPKKVLSCTLVVCKENLFIIQTWLNGFKRNFFIYCLMSWRKRVDKEEILLRDLVLNFSFLSENGLFTCAHAESRCSADKAWLKSIHSSIYQCIHASMYLIKGWSWTGVYPRCQRKGRPWKGHQFVAGLTQRDQQLFSPKGS